MWPSSWTRASRTERTDAEARCKRRRPPHPRGLSPRHGPPPCALRLFLDFEQLDFKNERCAAGDFWRSPLISIGEIRRADQFRLLSRLHQLQTLSPARDHAGERKLGRLPPLNGAVEDRSIDE